MRKLLKRQSDLGKENEDLRKKIVDSMHNTVPDVSLEIESACTSLQNQSIESLQRKIKDLELALQISKAHKSEKIYQTLLEKYKFPGAGHLKLACGVSDITTECVHAEIKKFEDWKEAIGQLQAYNVVTPRSELHVYLFGNYSQACKEIAISVIKSLNIHPYEVCVSEEEFVILDLLSGHEQRFDLELC